MTYDQERQRLIGEWLTESDAGVWLAVVAMLFILACMFWGLRNGGSE